MTAEAITTAELTDVAVQLSIWRDRMLEESRLPVAEVLKDLMCIVKKARTDVQRLVNPEEWSLGDRITRQTERERDSWRRTVTAEADERVKTLLEVEQDRHAQFEFAVQHVLDTHGSGRRRSDVLLTETDIGLLRLTERPKNCLWRSQITTVGQLLTSTDYDLLGITNMGRNSVDEIRQKLSELRYAVAVGGQAELDKREMELAAGKLQPRRKNSERDRGIWERHHDGASIKQLADQHKVSEGRIRQILVDERRQFRERRA